MATKEHTTITELREAARSVGARLFDTGVPCNRGHRAARYTSCSHCVECVRSSTAAYRRQNASAARERDRQYYAANRERIRAESRAARLVTRRPRKGPLRDLRRAAKERGDHTFDPGVPCIRGHVSMRWTQNGMCIACKRANDRGYNARNAKAHRTRSSRYQQENKEQYKAYQRRYLAENRGRVYAINAKRQATKRHAAIGDRAAYAAFADWAKSAGSVRCYWCRKHTKRGDRHIDHIIPLSRGGADAVGNLCVACPKCNLTKNAKLPEEFAGQSELALT